MEHTKNWNLKKNKNSEQVFFPKKWKKQNKGQNYPIEIKTKTQGIEKYLGNIQNNRMC